MTELLKSPSRSRPETFQPPWVAHSSVFPADWSEYVMGQFAVQTAAGADGCRLNRDLDEALAQSPAPLHVERIVSVDAEGYTNEIRLAYWQKSADYKAWLANPLVSEFTRSQLEGLVGLWREVIAAPADNLDLLGGTNRHLWGVGRHLRQVWERYHSYYGSMRDRMPNGRVPEIEAEEFTLQSRDYVASLGARLVVDLPHNLCFVRGLFGWRDSPAEVQRIFEDEMLPVYERGVLFLRENPVEISCITARLSDVVYGEPRTGVDAETLAWFTSLRSLEAWTHRHKTHADIFSKVREIRMRLGSQGNLELGHEVIVVPKGGIDAEYNNCHPRTGFLRFFPSWPAD